MKHLALFILLTCLIHSTAIGQSGNSGIDLNIMATAVSAESADVIPLMISVSPGMHSENLRVDVSEETGGDIFIMGTPYDSLGIQVPASVSITNQYGENATLDNLQIVYGKEDKALAMDVLSPAGCTMIQVPATGRIYIRIGAEAISEEILRGVYRGTLGLDCRDNKTFRSNQSGL